MTAADREELVALLKEILQQVGRSQPLGGDVQAEISALLDKFRGA